jgi:hypothetical protein
MVGTRDLATCGHLRLKSPACCDVFLLVFGVFLGACVEKVQSESSHAKRSSAQNAKIGSLNLEVLQRFESNEKYRSYKFLRNSENSVNICLTPKDVKKRMSLISQEK